MRFLSWLDGLKPVSSRRRTKRGQPQSPRRKPADCKLSVETLEDRSMPSFLAPVNYALGSDPYNPENPDAVVTADFNNDGILDLAVANSSDGTVSVLLGNGNGTFQPAQKSDRVYASSLAVGDFNADGKLDLATGSDGALSVLLGNGDGTFQPPSYINFPGTVSVAVGDFNADGKLDLGVVWFYFDDTGRSYSYVAVMLGKGDGSFPGASSTYDLSMDGADAVAVGDFNGDGKLDLATDSELGSVNVLLNDGSGTLLAPTRFYTGTSSVSVAAGGVNGDGIADLVAANNGSVSVLLGNGLGAFGAAQNYAAGSYPYPVELGDFNNDGNLDIATANHWSDDVTVLLGRGNGTFALPRSSAAGLGPQGLAIGDFNGDGWLDAATANFSGNNVSVLINDTQWPPVDTPSVTINDVSVTEGNTGTVNATFTVSLSAAYGQPVTVHYTTTDGSATAGSDYTAGSGDVTFAPGETSKTISVAVLGDRLPEATETFVVNLSSPTNSFINDGQGVGTIVDDEPRVSIYDVTMNEGNSGLTAFAFTVSLSVAYDVPVTVNYATANGTATAGSDYQAASGTLTIPAGQTSGTISVLVNGDRLGEPNETFFVNLNSLNYGVIADSQGLGTIVDDEPRISINDVTKKEGNGNKTTLFTFTVTLSAAYDQAVTMSFRTVDGSATTSDGDYIAKTGTLTFAPGETTKSITIEVKADHKKEANEDFYLDLFGNSSNSLITKSRGIGTILNDD
jgi:Calx-beta domain/FG-GAP-like repeat